MQRRAGLKNPVWLLRAPKPKFGFAVSQRKVWSGTSECEAAVQVLDWLVNFTLTNIAWVPTHS